MSCACAVGGFFGPLLGAKLRVMIGFRGMLSSFACGLIGWGLVVALYQLTHARSARRPEGAASYGKLPAEDEAG